MIKGTLYLVTNLNDLQYVDQRTTKVVAITDANTPIGVKGSILLPPYEASMYMCNNDINNFVNCYYAHLQSKEAVEFMLAIIQALRNGINIVLFSNPDELETYFGPFANFVCNMYGIIIGTPTIPFNYNPAYNAKNLSLLYEFGYINDGELYEYSQPKTSSPFVKRV